MLQICKPDDALDTLQLKALVIGGTSFIGSHLLVHLRKHNAKTQFTTRHTLDLLNVPDELPQADVVYICAAMTRFVECEDSRFAYRCNVDAPTQIAQRCPGSRIVYLSSEAVERAIHTAYGMHKALAEISLRQVCDPIIVRLSKVGPTTVHDCCDFLWRLSAREPGIYHWPHA